MWAEERELLSVLGDAIHQVDPVHGRRRLWKFEEDADRGLRHTGEAQALRLAEQAPHQIEVVDHAVEQRVPVGVAQHRVIDPDRRGDARLIIGLERPERLGIDVGAADDRVLGDIPLQRILRRGGGGEPQRLDVRELFRHPLDRRVVALHVADHQPHARLLPGRDDSLTLSLGKRDRFFDEHVPAGLGGRDRDRFVAAAGQHHHRVEWFLEQLGPVGEAPVDAVGLPHSIDDRAR